SLVNDVLMPPIGKVMGGVNFSDLFINLEPGKGSFASLKAAKDAGAAVIAYGSFLNTVIDFIIVAFCIFLVVKAMNSLKKKPVPVVPVAPEPTSEERLLSEIRDLLKTRV
ncbi:MAG: large conductance mechanosensitive channel protein MscL, partial [Verrucomicrobiota bacterium]